VRNIYLNQSSKHRVYPGLRCIPREWSEEGVEGSQGLLNLSALEDCGWQEVAAPRGGCLWGHGGGNCVLADG